MNFRNSNRVLSVLLRKSLQKIRKNSLLGSTVETVLIFLLSLVCLSLLSVRCQQNSSSGRKRSMISSRVKPSVSLMPSSVTHFPNCAAALLPRSLLVPLNTPSPLPDSESRPSPLQITSLFSVFPTSPSLAFNLLFRI